MTSGTSSSGASLAELKASDMNKPSCGSDRNVSRLMWLMIAGAALLVIGFATGSAVFGFAALAPILYAVPCLIMCGMCLSKHCGTAKS